MDTETKSSEAGSALLALSNDLAAAVERAGRSVVAVNARPRTPSSGVYWREGVVVTADHTVRRDEEITVTLPDGRSAPATLAGRDPSTDLAALRVEAAALPAAPTADASSLKVGHMVLAVGRREGDGQADQGSLGASLGVVSALGGSWRTWRGGQIDRLIRLDLTIFLGFSGGPLVDAQGRIVGINTTGLWRGAGLAIPASTVERVARELLAKGRIARGYLGLGMHPVLLPEALKRRLDVPAGGGMIVFSVEPQGPAERAGALIGDVLVALDGKPVGDLGDVGAALTGERVGKQISARLIRGGALIELAITVGERPMREA
jgi:serine protease DegQ